MFYENLQLVQLSEYSSTWRKIVPLAHMALTDESPRYTSFIIALNLCPIVLCRVMAVSIQANPMEAQK